MNRGVPSLTITVCPTPAPPSSGISGKLSIDIKDGKHAYTFNYTPPAN
jgi:hypothetical protein